MRRAALAAASALFAAAVPAALASPSTTPVLDRVGDGVVEFLPPASADHALGEGLPAASWKGLPVGNPGVQDAAGPHGSSSVSALRMVPTPGAVALLATSALLAARRRRS